MMSTAFIPAQTPPIETGVSQTLAKWRGANYSDVRYKLNLTLEKMSPTLKGTIEISVKLSEPSAVVDGLTPTIILDWRKLRGKEDLSTVSNVSVNGTPVVLSSDFSRLSVPSRFANGTPSKDGTQNFYEINEHLVFKDGVKIGENIIKLDFTSPILTSGSAITRYVDKEDNAEYIYSLFVPSDASTAFPVFDQPDLKARFQLNVTLPGGQAGWGAVSNGELAQKFINTTSHGSYTDSYLFYETKPISPYVFAFAVGSFEIFKECHFSDEIKGKDKLKCLETSNKVVSERDWSNIYVRKSQAEKFKQHAAEVFRLNREGVKFLEGYFDYKFPFPKYDLVLIPEFPFGGMEHAGATFLRESSVIFPTEPTKNDYVSRANLIFHEAAHQWFGDTVTMKWFDDLWLKEGFAEFMAYKTLEKVMPEYNAWKIFYERNKQAAYLTDSTKGTTPIYQEIPNLSSAKSAYGNIVYRKAPSFLKQAEFYLGEKEFQTAVRAFLKKHEFKNAEWTDLVKEFETASKQDLKDWGQKWVKKSGLQIIKIEETSKEVSKEIQSDRGPKYFHILDIGLITLFEAPGFPQMKIKTLIEYKNGERLIKDFFVGSYPTLFRYEKPDTNYILPNYQDYGYGIFLLDEKSRAYVLANIQNEKDDFLRSMMWGSLWDSVREGELNPKTYIELVIKNLELSEKLIRPTGVAPIPDGKPPVFPETDVGTINTLLNRVGTAMNYYLSEQQREELTPRLEAVLRNKIVMPLTPKDERITAFRAYVNLASIAKSRLALKGFLNDDKRKTSNSELSEWQKFFELSPLKTKDRFDIITKLLILGDEDAPALLAELEKNETSDEAKRYAYAARAGISTAENKAKFWNDFVANKEISESWIEAAFISFNSPKHAELTLPYLEKALAELPNLKRNRKIFFVNGWLAAFIGGQKSKEALKIINKFLADNPNLDRDLHLKILENSDALERAVKIRDKF